MPGKAAIFINNLLFVEQDVGEEELPVLFEAHEVSPALWIPMSSVGPVVRKGQNKIRIEFTPNDAAKPYRAQLRWASVMDTATEEEEPGTARSTNQANEGVDDRKEVKGKVVFEREFTADFALDLPWPPYPQPTSPTEDDHPKHAGLLTSRACWYRPAFS